MDDLKRALLLGSILALFSANSFATDSSSQWTVGAGALYLLPSYSVTPNYGSLNILNTVTGAKETESLTIDSEFLWGYEAFLSYQFPNHHRDITVKYMHLSGDESDSTTLGTLPTGYAYIASPFAYTGEGTVFSSVDNAQLVAGQSMHLWDALNLRLYAGVEYARIEQVITKKYDQGYTNSGIAIPGAYVATYESNSQFNGAGPILGVDADYELFRSHFGIMAGISAALLVGSMDQGNSLVFQPNTQSNTNVDNDYPATTESVTNLNANLALRYNHIMSKNTLHFELGYRVNQYYDAVATNNDLTLSGYYFDFAASFR